MNSFRALAFLSALVFPALFMNAATLPDSYAPQPVDRGTTIDSSRLRPPGFGAPFSNPSLEHARNRTFGPPTTPGPFANPAYNAPTPGQFPTYRRYLHRRYNGNWDRPAMAPPFHQHRFDMDHGGRDPVFGNHDGYAQRFDHRFHHHDGLPGDYYGFGPTHSDHPFNHRFDVKRGERFGYRDAPAPAPFHRPQSGPRTRAPADRSITV